MTSDVLLFVGEALGRYSFPHRHPFSIHRPGAFWVEGCKQGLDSA